MSTLLTQYFERYAEDAIAKMKEAILAVSFYERICASSNGLRQMG